MDPVEDSETKGWAVVACLALLLLLSVWYMVPRILEGPETVQVPIENIAKPDIEDSRKPVPAFTPDPIELPTHRPRRASAPGPVTTPAWVLDACNAYEGPGLNRAITTRLLAGEKVKWISKRDNWEQVYLPDGRQAWVPGNHLTFRPPQETRTLEPQHAITQVQAYFQDLEAVQLQRAYDRLSQRLKAEVTYFDFVDGNRSWGPAEFKVDRVEVISPSRVRLYYLRNAQPGQVLMVAYDSEWKIDQHIYQSNGEREPAW